VKYRPDLTYDHRPDKNILTLQEQRFRERWQEILNLAEPANGESFKKAIIEADTFVDGVLGELGLEGEHMADRLERLDPDEIGSMPKLWRAHRIRNDLVHTPGFVIAPADGWQVLQDYETFLKEIKVL
jgi:hypothetical protein